MDAVRQQIVSAVDDEIAFDGKDTDWIPVRDGKECFFINRNGYKTKVPEGEYDYLGIVSQNRIVAGKGGKYVYLDRQGNCMLLYLPFDHMFRKDQIVFLQEIVGRVQPDYQERDAYLFDILNAFSRGGIRKLSDFREILKKSAGYAGSAPEWNSSEREAAAAAKGNIIEIDGMNYEAYLGLAEVYTAMEEPDMALEVMEEVEEKCGFGELQRKVIEAEAGLRQFRNMAKTDSGFEAVSGLTDFCVQGLDIFLGWVEKASTVVDGISAVWRDISGLLCRSGRLHSMQAGE